MTEVFRITRSPSLNVSSIVLPGNEKREIGNGLAPSERIPLSSGYPKSQAVLSYSVNEGSAALVTYHLEEGC